MTQSDLADDADEQLVDAVVKQRRDLDELALASRRQPGAVCRVTETENKIKQNKSSDIPLVVDRTQFVD